MLKRKWSTREPNRTGSGPTVLAFRAGPLHLVVKTCLLYSSVVLKHNSILMVWASFTRSTNQANSQNYIPCLMIFLRSSDSSARVLYYLYTEAFCVWLILVKKGCLNRWFHSKTSSFECCVAFVSIINQTFRMLWLLQAWQDFLQLWVSYAVERWLNFLTWDLMVKGFLHIIWKWT